MSYHIKVAIGVSNLLIVESENDQYFIEALVKHINLDLEIHPPVCAIDDYQCLEGMGKLLNTLKSLPVKKDSIEKVGIIFDANSVGVVERTRQIKEKIKEVFGDTPPVEFLIHILNVEGSGELETILKSISSHEANFAECLNAWRECLPEGKELTDKDFDKFWVQIYQRYDCCSKLERKQANRKCSNEASMNKSIYNLDSEHLSELKEFLIGL